LRRGVVAVVVVVLVLAGLLVYARGWLAGWGPRVPGLGGPGASKSTSGRGGVRVAGLSSLDGSLYCLHDKKITRAL
jgi:hypothetical protein